MNPLRHALAFPLVAIALAAAPASAAGEAFVPPGNSAATQYTEAIPTAGGPKQTGKSKHHRQSSPAKALGARNAHKLDSKGPIGKATAQIAAETAPSSSTAPSPAPTPRGSTGQGGSRSPGGGAPGVGSTGGGKTSREHTGGGSSGVNPAVRAESPSGSSGVGAVLANATGSSGSGGAGLLLPLVPLATAVWAIGYTLSRRKRTLP